MSLIKKFANKWINPFVKRTLKFDFIWKLCTPFLFISKYLTHQRKLVFVEEEINNNKELARQLLSDLVVKNGPFKGMKYPEFRSIWSTLYSKLLGSYEYELEGIIENCCCENYTQILDIGCAEGYYAVGFALRIKNANIFAYDINEKALEQCKKMGILNGVSDRMSFHKGCTSETLIDFKFKEKSLMIIDCEGYEYDLLANENVCKRLINCDILIELHDYTKNYIIENNFKNTHQISFIESIDDFQKAKKYKFKEINTLSFNQKKFLLEERRPNIMEWVFLKSSYVR